MKSLRSPTWKFITYFPTLCENFLDVSIKQAKYYKWQLFVIKVAQCGQEETKCWEQKLLKASCTSVSIWTCPGLSNQLWQAQHPHGPCLFAPPMMHHLFPSFFVFLLWFIVIHAAEPSQGLVGSTVPCYTCAPPNCISCSHIHTCAASSTHLNACGRYVFGYTLILPSRFTQYLLLIQVSISVFL